MDTWGQPETSDNWLPGFHDEFQDLFPDINFDTDPVHCTTYEFETMMAPEFNLSFLAEYDRPFDSTAECSSFSEACDISTVHFQHNVDIACPEDVLLTPRSIAVPPAELLEAPCRPENSPSTTGPRPKTSNGMTQLSSSQPTRIPRKLPGREDPSVVQDERK
jgi:hypothetical protein